MYDPLTRAAIHAGTDKFGYHDYTPNYFKMFAPRKDEALKILEIGVGGYADDDRGGQSLAVWRDFFPKAQITGIDIQKKTLDLGPRVNILQGSQIDADFLTELVTKCGPFDIIIDDGSHRNEHVVASFDMLFPTLAPGGIYVAEDVQTAFHPRFGGSLEMTAPNSVGYFGTLLADMDQGIAGIERYHNMIAVHKATDTHTPNIFDSPRFADLADKQVHCIGPKPSGLPAKMRKISHQQRSVADTDLLVCTLDADQPFDQIRFEEQFATVTDGGIMVVRAPTPDPTFTAYVQHRFTMIDHVEIKVHYPDAPIDALAAQIYAMEQSGDAVLFYKSPNTFPSNFAYDPTNPQASAALDHMETVLKDATSEGGLVQYADILTRHRSREDARATLAKLADLGATSRQYYQMAGGLAQRDKRLEDAITLYTAALAKFPHDPQFTCMCAAAQTGLGALSEAETLLREALAVYPRARALVGALSRHLLRVGQLDEARQLVQSTITLFPQQLRPARLLMLAQIARKQGDLDAAQTAIDSALSAAPQDALICEEYSKLARDRDAMALAVDYAARAVSLAPDNPRLHAYHATLAS